tara:strand:+ start:657 stop:1496 length:840 start_codon:yes stop_codon:yes gene_type:complete
MSTDQNINIKRFDPSRLGKETTILLIGKRNTGKSTLLRDLMYHMKDKLDFGVLMSPTEEATGDMKDLLPAPCIYNSFNSTAVDVLLDVQKQTVKTGNFKSVFLITDDCMYDKKVMKTPQMRAIFMNGRHRKLFYINCMQYMMDLGPELRCNTDYVFALRENIISNRAKLHQFFFGMFDTLGSFSKVFDKCTQGYECMVLDNTVRSNNVEDCVFWYQAEHNLPKFRMCKPVYWRLSDKYNRDDDDDDQPVVGVAERALLKNSANKTGLTIVKEGKKPSFF